MKIEKYLVLYKYLLSLFGVEDFREIKDHLSDVRAGTDTDGRTFFLNAILAHFPIKDESLKENLIQYDLNIQNYQKRISYRREPVSLKYFQYLAVLFSEIFLDNLKNRKQQFLWELNRFLQEYSQRENIQIAPFEERDLYKIAYWMATGSGKTLIMHINYYQFQRYRFFFPDNILLITPNEGLSHQHHEELERSGIPARLYSDGFRAGGENEVLVIEMTKFVEEKKGRGVTLPVEAFEGRNLVFVDEGHKGKRSEEQKWAKLRNRLAENGFVFEYSATFGQILDEQNRDVLEEYAKSILFDYSYKYFYLDNYGKDFSVLNIRPMRRLTDMDFQETMFIANLLSFYQQLLIYEENRRLAQEHNLEKPLWIFVGTTVTGKEEESDVLQIVEFIAKTLSEESWLEDKAKRILSGEYKDEQGIDIFKNKFPYLRDGLNLTDLYRRVFAGRGRLEVYELKNAPGELGLKVGEGDYFGVVNIGDVASFKKLLEGKGIPISQDVISSSLFDKIKTDDSPINILIGSKKFIEGWDTWRVSSMGLLNIGRGQGPQIIQLFGRGVRLKGKGMTLKRSADSPQLKILETLYIYSIKADYLERFLASLTKEMDYETIPVPVKFQHKEKWKELLIPAIDERRDFSQEKPILLDIDEKIYFTLKLLPRIYRYESEERREEESGAVATIRGVEQRFPLDKLELLDWGRIYNELCQFKEERGYNNLIFDEERLMAILLSDRYKLLVDSEILELKDWQSIGRLEDLALLILKRYIETFYNRRKKDFETENLTTHSVEARQLPLFAFERMEDEYVYNVRTSDRELAKRIREIAKNLEELLKDEREILPRLYIDNHLFVPLLIQRGTGRREILSIHPTGLVESEVEFLNGVKKFLGEKKELFRGKEIFLLRNFPQSGIGFQLEWSRFYPDFIMWVKEGNEQVIAFIDPKGLIMTKGLEDEKVKFATEGIKEVEKKLGRSNIRLECFILSITEYEELERGVAENEREGKEVYEEHNILFLKDEDWMEKFFKRLLGGKKLGG